jgi:hypothetical protein
MHTVGRFLVISPNDDALLPHDGFGNLLPQSLGALRKGFDQFLGRASGVSIFLSLVDYRQETVFARIGRLANKAGCLVRLASQGDVFR